MAAIKSGIRTGTGGPTVHRDRPTRVKQAKIVVNMNYLQATCAACSQQATGVSATRQTRRMRNAKTDGRPSHSRALAHAHYECERTRKAAQKRDGLRMTRDSVEEGVGGRHCR